MLPQITLLGARELNAFYVHVLQKTSGKADVGDLVKHQLNHPKEFVKNLSTRIERNTVITLLSPINRLILKDSERDTVNSHFHSSPLKTLGISEC